MPEDGAVTDPRQIAGFLAAIAAEPDDDLPKLIFSDYLDEQGDSAGEGMRVAALLRFRPVIRNRPA